MSLEHFSKTENSSVSDEIDNKFDIFIISARTIIYNWLFRKL